MRLPIRRRHLLPFLALLLPLAGCPQHVVQLADEIRPPEDYKPVYMTSSIPIDSIVAEHQRTGGSVEIGRNPADAGNRPDPSTGGGRGDSSGIALSGNVFGAPAPLLSMDIRNVDDSRYPDEVELRAFVYDSSGRFVMGMAPPYAKGEAWRSRWPRLIDSCGGEAVTIENFEVTEVRQDAREPYAIAFVLDHSGSMGEERILNLRSGVARVLSVIKPGDGIATVKFGSGSEVDVPLTPNPAVYRRSFVIENTSPPGGGGTALYDAAITGIYALDKAPRTHRRALILFTDGFDGDSKVKVDSLHRLARQKRVTIYTVAYGRADVDVMRDIALYTGGRMYRIYSYREFPYVFSDIYRGLNNYYRITYRPPLCAGIHRATVTASLPELGFPALHASGEYDRSLFTPFDPVGSIALVNIEFDYDKATIRPESMPEIEEVARMMERYPTLKMEVRGHTDDRGSDEYNLRLSQERADAVADALVAMRIEPERLTRVGFGETRPLVANDNDENRRRNRRTEFVIISR